jgi:hypothetical protein
LHGTLEEIWPFGSPILFPSDWPEFLQLSHITDIPLTPPPILNPSFSDQSP